MLDCGCEDLCFLNSEEIPSPAHSKGVLHQGSVKDTRDLPLQPSPPQIRGFVHRGIVMLEPIWVS